MRNVGYRFVPVKSERPERAGRGDGERAKGAQHDEALLGAGARGPAPAR